MLLYNLILSIICFIFSIFSLDAQTYFTKDGEISFYSHTPLEEIEAKNKKAVSILNLSESKVEFSVLIKGFLFKNALMQTHFNENYMDSDTYPKAVFKGELMDLSGFDIKKDREYTIPVKGILTIRDKDRPIDSSVILTVVKGQIKGETNFIVSPADFNIEIPSLVKGKIAEEIEVSVHANYQLYEKS